MRKIIVLLLLLAGAGLLWHGVQVRNSLKGAAQQADSAAQNAFNGNPKTTDATWFMIGGGALLIIGAGTALKQ